jgi:hypothetical protein
MVNSENSEFHSDEVNEHCIDLLTKTDSMLSTPVVHSLACKPTTTI